MRGIKAEGGWAVVCTEQCRDPPLLRHHALHRRRICGTTTTFRRCAAWPSRCIAMARWRASSSCHSGMNGSNLYSRRESHRAQRHADHHLLQRSASRRAPWTSRISRSARAGTATPPCACRHAGFDLVYVYAGHGLGAPQHFLSRRLNHRSDEYGGSLENRARLLREIIEDTKERSATRCAVSVRVSIDELIGPPGCTEEEMHDAIGLMAELPDLWDLTLSGWDNDSGTSRFAEEGFQEPYVAGVKKLTTQAGGRRRPLHLAGYHGVAGQPRHPGFDRRGAAVHRRSLPAAQDRGRPARRHPGMHRLQHLRHRRHDHVAHPLHPEPHHGRGMAARLASGADPRRRVRTSKRADRRRRAGGPRMRPRPRPARLSGDTGRGRQGAGRPRSREWRLPGLSAWARVRDYRLQQIKQLPNVETYLDSRHGAPTSWNMASSMW